jgi:hypothetical protein
VLSSFDQPSCPALAAATEGNGWRGRSVKGLSMTSLSLGPSVNGNHSTTAEKAPLTFTTGYNPSDPYEYFVYGIDCDGNPTKRQITKAEFEKNPWNRFLPTNGEQR